MGNTIEEMIKSGCTYEEAVDALQDMWESAVAERERNTKEAEARENVVTAYKKYLQIICPAISKKHLEQQVAQLESTLSTISDIYNGFTKINDLQLKSKEESDKTVDDLEGWVKKLFNKIDAERKNAESATKTYKVKPEKPNTSLDDFLKEMGW